MITRVQVKNFRSLADVDVTLGPLTVLVGRNGAGKSNFVDVLRFVSDALRLGLDTAIPNRHGIAVLRRWSPRGRPYDVEISLTVETSRLQGEYTLVIRTGQRGEYYVKREICRVKQGTITEEFEVREGQWITPPLKTFAHSGIEVLEIEPTALALPAVSVFVTQIVTHLRNLRDFLTRTGFYTIFPNTLREPQKPSNEYPLAEHGENLASALRRLKKRGEWFPDLLTALQQVVDDVSDVRVRKIGGYLITELKHEEQNGRSPWFELAQESDGTLRMLGLLVALYQDPPPPLIAIEEPELTIHPGALGMLSDVLREASQRSQVLITTQSPDLISYFGADELRVVEKAKGVTHIGSVDDKQREALNEQLFSAGDLLRIEGLRRAPVPVVGGNSA